MARAAIPRSIPVACETCVSRGSGLCGRLSVRTHARLAEIARCFQYAADQSLRNEGSRPNFVGIVRSGYLRAVRHTVEGRRQILAFAGPGDLIGEALGAEADYGIEAVTPAAVCRFDRTAFARLMEEETDLRRAVYRSYAEGLDNLRRVIWSLRLLSPEERFCAFLVLACASMPFEPLPTGGGVLTVVVPRTDIADLLGTTKETISRVTYRLEASGLIAIRDPRHFVIPDIAKLRQAGGLPAIAPPVAAAQPGEPVADS